MAKIHSYALALGKAGGAAGGGGGGAKKRGGGDDVLGGAGGGGGGKGKAAASGRRRSNKKGCGEASVAWGGVCPSTPLSCDTVRVLLALCVGKDEDGNEVPEKVWGRAGGSWQRGRGGNKA